MISISSCWRLEESREGVVIEERFVLRRWLPTHYSPAGDKFPLSLIVFMQVLKVIWQHWLWRENRNSQTRVQYLDQNVPKRDLSQRHQQVTPKAAPPRWPA